MWLLHLQKLIKALRIGLAVMNLELIHNKLLVIELTDVQLKHLFK